MKQEMISVEQARQLPALYTKTVPTDYIDNLGHMNMNRYYDILGPASGAMLRLMGHTEKSRDEQHIGNFVLMHVMKYLKEVLVGEQVTVHGRVIGRTEKKVHKMYFMVNDTKENVAATQESLNIHADLQARRSSPFIPAIAEKIDGLIADHSQLDWDAPVSEAIRI